MSTDDVFLGYIQLQNPSVFRVLAYGYATLWFTTPFFAASYCYLRRPCLRSRSRTFCGPRCGIGRIAAETVVARNDLLVTSADAKETTAAQWCLMQDIQRRLPDATVVVRMHKLVWRCDAKIALPPIFAVLVTQRIGPFTLRREYVAPEA